MIQHLQLSGLAVEFGENTNLCSQQLGNNWDGNIVYGPVSISLEAIQIGEVHGGNEDDGGLLKARVLTDKSRQLKAIEFGHADIHQNNSDIGLQQPFEGFFPRIGLDQVLAQLPQ